MHISPFSNENIGKKKKTMSVVGEAALSVLFNTLLTKLSSSEVVEIATEKQAFLEELKEKVENLRKVMDE